MPKRKNWTFEMIELTDEQMKIAKQNGISWSAVRNRVDRGWEIEEAVRLPLRATRGRPAKIQETQEIQILQETKEDRKRAWERRMEQAKNRMEIAVFASEIGISYGVAASCLDSGMSREEIREKYGHRYEKSTHRWAKS